MKLPFFFFFLWHQLQMVHPNALSALSSLCIFGGGKTHIYVRRLTISRFLGHYFSFPITTLLLKIFVSNFSNLGYIHNISTLISLKKIVVQTFYLFCFTVKYYHFKISKPIKFTLLNWLQTGMHKIF